MDQKKNNAVMEICISSKSAKFLVDVIFLITIVFLVRVESHIFSGPEDRVTDSSSSYGSQSAPSQTQQSTSSSSQNTYEFPETWTSQWKTDTRKSPLPITVEWISEASLQINELLSPSTLSRADIFQYLLREMSRASNKIIKNLKTELDSRLKNNKIRDSVMPYARALKSIIDSAIDLRQTKSYIVEIRNYRGFPPPKVSSPPALSSYGLFSSDIFADPDASVRLVNKLLYIPNSEIPNLIVKLQDYLKIFNKEYAEFVLYRYKWYADSLIFFLKGTRLEDLKHNMAEIQHISDLNRNSTAGRENNN